ncbi:MAG: DUF2723 domain-containing protein [Deltaproteobacteria bacterium]|nr:DUF2723 domain-containing protein [Deltaproteobacteria bacterium]
MIPAISRNAIWGLGAALISLAVYIPTLAPDITWGDAGELITASYTFGSAHPSGYPLFCLLGKVFSLIPLGSVAYRYNLFCALCVAVAVAGTARLGSGMTGNGLASLAGAVTTAFSRTVWYHAHTTEVYALHLALVAWVCWTALRLYQERSRRYLYWAVFLVGVGMTNHLTSALLALPVLFIMVATERPIWKNYRVLAKILVLVLAPLTLYLYLPLAAHYSSGVSWGQPDTWERFWIVITGKQYHFRFGLHNAITNSKMLMSHMLVGFHPAVLVTAAAGMMASLRLALIPGPAWILGFLSFGGYTLLYRIDDLDAYFAPLDLFVGLWFGVGLHLLGCTVHRLATRGAPPHFTRLRMAAVIAVGLVGVAGTGAAVDQVRRNWEFVRKAGVDARDYVRSIFSAAEGRTLVITKGDGYTFALWYQKFVVTRRRDLTVVDVRMLGMNYGQWFLDHLRTLDPDLELVHSMDVRYNRDYLLDHNYRKFDTVLAVNLGHHPLPVTGRASYEWGERRRWYARVRATEKPLPWLRALAPRADIEGLEMGPGVENGRLVEKRRRFRRNEQIVVFVKWKTLVNHRTDFNWYGPGGQVVLRQHQYTPAEWRYSWAWMNERFSKKPGKWRVEVVVDGDVRKSIDFLVQ